MNVTNGKHDSDNLNSMFSPVGVHILIVWAVCFVALLVCTGIDKCDEINLEACQRATMPIIPSASSRASSTSDLQYEDAIDISVEIDNEPYGSTGYASIHEYLHSRHNSTSSD